MLSQNWQEILTYIESNVADPHRTQLLTLCKEFEVHLNSTPALKPKKQSKRDVQNKIVSENPYAGNLQNILKGL
jgi:hypothetical protein